MQPGMLRRGGATHASKRGVRTTREGPMGGEIKKRSKGRRGEKGVEKEEEKEEFLEKAPGP